MALRKASAYSKKYARPNTRVSRKKSRSYVKVVPHNKIAKYTIGDASSYRHGKHPFVLRMISLEGVQIRDNALEAARMLLTKQMDTHSPGQYCLVVKPYPHHLLRENKTAAGAGADRLSKGMTQSFGAIIGRAALVRPNTTLFEISCANDKAVRAAREALRMVKSKVPCKTQSFFEKIA